MSDQKFSIIIPVQNGAATIERLFGSLIIQKGRVYEVLVCNDNSTDNTLDVVDWYSKSLPIKVFDVPEHLQNNPGHARQVGLDHATGEWIVFIDADDLLTFNALNCYETLINSNQSTKLICTAFDEIKFDPFEMINHIPQPLAWVHAKAFNRKYIVDSGLKFHPDLYTHEDKYFVFLNIFDMRIKGLAPIGADATTYYWCRSPNTIVAKNGGKYPITSLAESMSAIIDSCELVSNNNHLSHMDINRFFRGELIGTIFDAYNKVNGAAFFWGKPILDTYNIYKDLTKRLTKIKRMTGWANSDIKRMFQTEMPVFENARRDTLRTIGQFTPFQTFDDFVESITE